MSRFAGPERERWPHEATAAPDNQTPAVSAASPETWHALETIASLQNDSRAAVPKLFTAVMRALRTGADLRNLLEALYHNHEDCRIAPLKPLRLAEPFEALQKQGDDDASQGKRPRVWLAGLAADPEREPLGAFARELLETGGFAVPASDPIDSPQAALKAFAARECQLVVLCCPPGNWPDWGDEAVRGLKSAGAWRVWLATDSAESVPPGWCAGGLDGVMTPDGNALEPLLDLSRATGVRR